MTSTCNHRSLQIMAIHALGVTVECLNCDEAFDIAVDMVEEKYYHFTHHSPKGPQGDRQILIHHKVIER